MSGGESRVRGRCDEVDETDEVDLYAVDALTLVTAMVLAVHSPPTFAVRDGAPHV